MHSALRRRDECRNAPKWRGPAAGAEASDFAQPGIDFFETFLFSMNQGRSPSWPENFFPYARPFAASGISEQKSAETFLLKMPVVSQYAGQALAPHSLHGNAIGQTVALVRAGTVQIKPGLK